MNFERLTLEKKFSYLKKLLTNITYRVGRTKPIVELSQAEYDSLPVKDTSTVYLING